LTGAVGTKPDDGAEVALAVTQKPISGSHDGETALSTRFSGERFFRSPGRSGHGRDAPPADSSKALKNFSFSGHRCLLSMLRQAGRTEAKGAPTLDFSLEVAWSVLL
jgi:hypothetical protein